MTDVSVVLRIAADHPALAGHFPGRPIVPGVLVLDEVLHAIQSQHSGQAGDTAWRLGVVKFHRVAPPDQALQLHYQSQHGGVFSFELRAGTDLIVSGTLIAGGAPIVKNTVTPPPAVLPTAP